MAERTEVDLERIRQEAARLAQTSRHLTEAFEKMRYAAQEHEGCWGDDDIGKNFAKGYVAPAKEVLWNSDTAQQSLRRVSEHASRLPDRFAGVDSANARRVSRASYQSD